MFELLIDKVIGEDWWGQYTGVSDEVSARFVRDSLAKFPDGEREMRVVIDSPGGDVFEGITIFNIIRDFARSHADVRITTYIQGMAASMASVIALAANSVNSENKVVAEDNSVFMLHNAWDIVWGNRNDLRDAADFLEQIDGVLCGVYVKRTGKSDEEIAALMDAETWFWGEEIKDAGFADSIIDGSEEREKLGVPKEKAFAVSFGREQFANAKKTMQTVAAKASKSEGRNWGAAAMALGFATHGSSSGGSPADDKDTKGGCMKITAEELKRDNPDVFNQILSDGERVGADKERARASRLLQMGEKSGAKDYALECIKNGSDPADAAVVDAFMDKGAAARALEAQAEDEKDIPDVNPPKNDKNADMNAVMAAFNRETGVDKWED